MKQDLVIYTDLGVSIFVMSAKVKKTCIFFTFSSMIFLNYTFWDTNLTFHISFTEENGVKSHPKKSENRVRVTGKMSETYFVFCCCFFSIPSVSQDHFLKFNFKNSHKGSKNYWIHKLLGKNCCSLDTLLPWWQPILQM